MSAVVKALYEPDLNAMRAHVEHLFGGDLGDCANGKIELAWTDNRPDTAGRYRLKNARLYGVNEISELVDYAAMLNSTNNCNAYIGAALRRPDAAPFGRAQDSDAYALTCAYVDLDDPGAAGQAKDIYGLDKPTFIVLTGRAPHVRAQMWWKLDEPIQNTEWWPSLLRGIAHKMGGDGTVTNPSRVMRLAGSIAWPVKPGRTIELTSIAPLREPGPPSYAVEHLAGLFPAIAEGSTSAVPAPVAHTTNSLGLADRIADGRESYMRDTIAACLVEYIGTNGAAPNAQELFDAAWPQYERKVDLTRAGRGPEEFAEKCAYTIKRFERGEIHGAETLEAAVASYAKKERARALSGSAPQRELPPPAIQTGAIKTTSFYTLLTEDVPEEPDYIEPGFAGPGTFVLIAGPPKAQKSFLLQEMLVSCATGTPFLMDTFKVVRPLRVFYLQAEMNRKLLRKRAREFTMLTPEQRSLLKTNLIVSERFHMILNEDGVKTAVAAIKAAFPDSPPDIIAVDPLANVFDQENENDNTQLMRFLTARVEAVRQAVNPMACVVMVHHATKRSAEDMSRDPFVAIRGASALRGYYDSAIVIFRASEESKARKVHFELRSGESPEPMLVELTGGRFQTADRVSSIDKPMARQMLAVLREAWESDEPLSPNRQSKTEGRYAVFNLSEQFKVKAKEVDHLLNQWMANRVIAMRPKVSRGRPAGLEVIGNID